MTRLLGEGKRVVCFPISEYWLDIGQYDDYERAQTAVAGDPMERGKAAHGCS